MSPFGLKVEEFTTDSGKDIIFRYASLNDINELTKYINTVSKEDTFITFSGEEVSNEEEEIYLKEVCKHIENHDAVKLIAEYDGVIIGSADVTRDLQGKKRTRHVAGFGISITAEYRGEGIGERLMNAVINEAKTHIEELKIIKFTVYEKNVTARALYTKLGFKEYSRLPKGIYFKEEYMDEIGMYKVV